MRKVFFKKKAGGGNDRRASGRAADCRVKSENQEIW
jgi:hypothetical protein